LANADDPVDEAAADGVNASEEPEISLELPATAVIVVATTLEDAELEVAGIVAVELTNG